MAGLPVEIGQSFHKTGLPLVVWTVDSFNEEGARGAGGKKPSPSRAHFQPLPFRHYI